MEAPGYALVVGGGGGIGGPCCLAFVRNGCLGIVIADRDIEAAKRIADECGRLATSSSFRAEAVQMDVTSEESVTVGVAFATTLFGRIDYCLVAAGIGAQAASQISDAGEEEFNRFLKVNVTGTFLVLKVVSAFMKSQEARLVSTDSPARGTTRGAIVVIASASSHVAQPGIAQYVTSKHAVLGLAKTAALDNVPYGIRVNCVSPTWVDTPMVRRAIDGMPELDNLIKSAVPMGRVALAEEVADVVIFLASSRASYMTGCSLIVDGGTTLTSHN